jgi:hypothetical protein
MGLGVVRFWVRLGRIVTAAAFEALLLSTVSACPAFSQFSDVRFFVLAVVLAYNINVNMHLFAIDARLFALGAFWSSALTNDFGTMATVLEQVSVPFASRTAVVFVVHLDLMNVFTSFVTCNLRTYVILAICEQVVPSLFGV